MKFTKSKKNNTKNTKITKNKTLRCKKTSNKQKSHIINIFLEMMDTIKIFHWKTKTFSIHEATDEIHQKLAKNTDRFVEVLLGKCKERIKMVENRINLIDIKDEDSFKEKMFEYRNFLIDLDIVLNSKKDSDLVSIKDDILADINQFLYLLSFK